jgi:hypothetical protein
MRKLIGVLFLGLVAFVMTPAVGYTADDPSPQIVQTDYKGEYIQVIASTPTADVYTYESLTAISTLYLEDSHDVGWQRKAALSTKRYFHPSTKYGIRWYFDRKLVQRTSKSNQTDWNITNYKPPTL